MVSLIRGAVKRLGNLKTRAGTNALPVDLPDVITKVFQTSSNSEFNEYFKLFRMQHEVENARASTATLPTTEFLLNFAENKYRKMMATNEWSGVTHKARETVFFTSLQKHGGGPICFNCGNKHSLKDCTMPRDGTRIKANKKLFWDKKKGGNSDASTNQRGRNTSSNKNSTKPPKDPKWAVPTEEENKNRNQRTIDGKLHYYQFKTKRWKPVPATVAAVAVAAPAVALSAPLRANST